MQLRHCRLLLAAAFGAIVQLYPAPSLATESENAEVIAAQLRRQGVACTTPRSAARDTDNSTPHETVWKLHCDEASYLVTLVPHLGAHITPICREDQRHTSDGAEKLGKK
jgi:hypothetical protein